MDAEPFRAPRGCLAPLVPPADSARFDPALGEGVCSGQDCRVPAEAFFCLRRVRAQSLTHTQLCVLQGCLEPGEIHYRFQVGEKSR